MAAATLMPWKPLYVGLARQERLRPELHLRQQPRIHVVLPAASRKPALRRAAAAAATPAQFNVVAAAAAEVVVMRRMMLFPIILMMMLFLVVVVVAVRRGYLHDDGTGTGTAIHGLPRDLDLDLVRDQDGRDVAAQVRPEDGQRRDDGREVDLEHAEDDGRRAVPGGVEGGPGAGFVLDLRGEAHDGAGHGAVEQGLLVSLGSLLGPGRMWEWGKGRGGGGGLASLQASERKEPDCAGAAFPVCVGCFPQGFGEHGKRQDDDVEDHVGS